MRRKYTQGRIGVTPFWSPYAIRNMCREFRYYTCGDNVEFGRMLSFVSSVKPTDANMITVANDIFDHSDVEGLMQIYHCSEDDVFVGIMNEIDKRVLRMYHVKDDRKEARHGAC